MLASKTYSISLGPSCSGQLRISRRAGLQCRCQQQPQQEGADQQWPVVTRRNLALAAPAMLLLRSAGSALASEASAAAAAVAADISDSISSLPSPNLERFLDNDWELQVPSNYTFIETPIVRVERGPQPERSPVLGRFEAPGGQPGLITILIRKAQALKQTLLQVTDISQLGDPIEVAKLVLPRGSELVANTILQVPQPSKNTPLGTVEIPPQNYYIYEFTTNTGLHVAMAAAAKRGSVLICGASITADQWAEAGPVFSKVVKSFRLRSQPTIG